MNDSSKKSDSELLDELQKLHGFNDEFKDELIEIKIMRLKAYKKASGDSINNARSLRSRLNRLNEKESAIVSEFMGKDYWYPGDWSCGSY